MKHQIFLSINNNEKVLQFPILPAEINFSQEQNNQVFTTNNGDINIIGDIGLEEISFSSFFPLLHSNLSQNTDLVGFDYVDWINEQRQRKLPFRLVITNTNINMPVSIDSFSYTYDTKIRFDITFKRFRFVG